MKEQIILYKFNCQLSNKLRGAFTGFEERITNGAFVKLLKMHH